jgi:hypothetical protein
MLVSANEYSSLLDAFESQAIDPTDFSTIVRPGRIPPDPLTCLQVQCGNITQDQFGLDNLADCAFGGFPGVRSCNDPLCEPYCQPTYPPQVQEQQNSIIDAMEMGPQDTKDMIPYSAPKGVQPYPFAGRSNLGHETKRRRDYYQEMVLCPGGEVSLFEIGMNTWKDGIGAVMDKLHVLGDMTSEEVVGMFLPPLIVGGLGWLLLAPSTTEPSNGDTSASAPSSYRRTRSVTRK